MAEQPLLVLAKITAILDAFTLSEPLRTASEIRASTGLPASTAHRLLANLVDHGFLEREGERYRIGVRMAYWAGPATRARDFTELLTPQLQALRDETGETACFFRVEQGARVCVGVAETRHGLKREMYVGRIQPLHVGSSGRVLLAWTDGLLDEVASGELPALTEATITDPDVLRAAVAQTRAAGYAITVGERMEAASGLAAPVFDQHAALVGALTVMGPTLRMPVEVCEQLVDAVVTAADALTAAFGGRKPSAA
ncbi:IclR family transcriptional regulator [Microbacterium sp. JZ70]|uniref:IclR family transcriptional regulator n=1 Tax=Microbacterium barkeri TaxID=33917 RepID=A0A9W6H559_9MICO|nr:MULTISPECIES: IclR family transcriptional regulator [Microbacterium]MDR6875640.1 DNA-binding IclR family transcriptional regulator [Microbacterium barkeri]WRH17800.1 helix-turn-helix domain-containing protein [Microbacterium sp. JZ37]GLJ62273.1 IclR family transcriptional regulator [Microbacterium barkeri]